MEPLLKRIFRKFPWMAFWSLLACSYAGHAMAGEPQVPTDSIVHRPFFSGIDLSLDYGKLITYPTNFESKLEAGASLRFLQRLAIVGEYGTATLNPQKAFDNVTSYTIKGSYMRAGLDYYLPIDKKNSIYFGLRYGSSAFEDKGEFVIDSEFWGNYQDGFGSDGLSANWGELVFGTETKLAIGKPNARFQVKGLLLGWDFRFRILGEFVNREPIRIYAIPGYGRTTDKTTPALNFYLKYRIGS